MTNLIVGIIITMIFSAFFSGMEIAFVSSNRLRAEMEREKNGLADKAISFFYRHPNDFVSTMLVGNNIALVVYGISLQQYSTTPCLPHLMTEVVSRPTRCYPQSLCSLQENFCPRRYSRRVPIRCCDSLLFLPWRATSHSFPSRVLPQYYQKVCCGCQDRRSTTIVPTRHLQK